MQITNNYGVLTLKWTCRITLISQALGYFRRWYRKKPVRSKGACKMVPSGHYRDVITPKILKSFNWLHKTTPVIIAEGTVEGFTRHYCHLRSYRQLMVLEKGKLVFFREDAFNRMTDEFLICSIDNVTGQNLQWEIKQEMSYLFWLKIDLEDYCRSLTHFMPLW